MQKVILLKVRDKCVSSLNSYNCVFTIPNISLKSLIVKHLECSTFVFFTISLIIIMHISEFFL